MNYIVLDLEWNMGNRREELKVMPFEIIEIGAVKLDSGKSEIERFSRLIHPRVYRRMHWMNKSIVHISNSDLKSAAGFEEVYSEFLAFCGDDPYIFCTWGDTDLTELQRNIFYFDCIPLTEGPLEYLDVQKLNGYNEGSHKNRISLEKAVEKYEISEVTDFHRAVNDASYTAEILKHIDSRFEKYTYFNTYYAPEDREKEIERDYGDYIKQIFKCYKDKHTLIHDKRIRNLSCPVCKAVLEKSIPPFSLNGKNYLMMGSCKDHGTVKAKIRIKKNEQNNLPYAVKTTRIINDEEKDALEKKYQKSISSKLE